MVLIILHYHQHIAWVRYCIMSFQDYPEKLDYKTFLVPHATYRPWLPYWFSCVSQETRPKHILTIDSENQLQQENSVFIFVDF